MGWSNSRDARARRRWEVAVVASFAKLERRVLRSAAHRGGAAEVSSIVASGANLPLDVHGYDPTNPTNPSAPPEPQQLLTTSDVQALLERAAAAADLKSAIIAVVDRNGTILGVRVESGVSPQITGNTTNLVFAIDGAVSLARTGAFFGNSGAPLTSRTVQQISQTTITQRELDSNPDVPDPGGNSTIYGPGYVAPVGIKGHFPPGIQFTPQVDLFDIESSNRDSTSTVTGTRFNVPSPYIPPGGSLVAPESYGQVTGILPTAQSRGIATLPGGIPLYEIQPDGKPAVVGGIGVFFPGTTGYATEENSTLNTPLLRNKHEPDFSQIAEYMAFVAAGGSKMAGVPFNGPVNGAPALSNFTEPFARDDLVGITLNFFGNGGLEGIKNLLNFGARFGSGSPNDGNDYPVNQQGATLLAGQGVPYGWLVTPHAGGDLTADDVEAIVTRGIAEADQVRSQLRAPLNSTAKMVFAVCDENGNILGLYRMPDATVFSLGVAVAKARNVAYYDNPSQLQPEDKLKGVPAGAAFTARTFRYVSLPFFPEGIDINPPGPGSIRNDGGVTKYGTTKGPPLPAKAFQTLQGFNDFNPNTNFRDPYNKANQNGVVFFPGSAPLYKDLGGSASRQIVGGLGVSGDGVFQDDDVTAVAALAYAPPSRLRADMFRIRGVRLPFFKFNRNPHIPLNGPKLPLQVIKPPLPAPRPKRSR
jgi:uncharacterized protein GlcG (DUF336 family)